MARRFRNLRSIRLLTAPLAAAVLLSTSAATSPRIAAVPGDEASIVHALSRMTFGVAPGEVERVRTMGLEAYVEQQLRPERIPDEALRARLARFETLNLDTRTIAQRYYMPVLQVRRDVRRRQGRSDTAGAAPAREMQPETPQSGAADPSMRTGAQEDPLARDMSPEEQARIRELRREGQKVLGELGAQRILRAVHSERQLEEVLVDFWFNHFNVFAGKGPVRIYLTEYEREAIRPHVMGRFREILGAVARSPAMLFYLDNWQSSDPKAAGRMERALEQRGRQAERGGAARRGGPGRAGAAGQRGGMADRLAGMSGEEREEMLAQIRQRMPRGLNENYARELLELHTLGVDGGYTQQDVVEVAKAFTGWTIRGPQQGGGYWFDDRRHVKGPKTVLGTVIDAGGEKDGEAVLDLLAAHPSTARFIATKLARRFVADDPPASLVEKAAATFRATKGDLREVTRTILTSPEFHAPEARRAKVKTPFEFVASALRAAGAEVTNGMPLLRSLQQLGMPLYFAQPPTGYADKAEAWVNTGALLNRMNFALALVNNQVPGTRVDLAALTGGSDVEQAKARMLDAVLRGQASESTKQTIDKGTGVAQVAALALGSPEFQRR